LPFFHVVHILSLFDLLFFCIFQIVSLFESFFHIFQCFPVIRNKH
jgi:hypothetical protein